MHSTHTIRGKTKIKKYPAMSVLEPCPQIDSNNTTSPCFLHETRDITYLTREIPLLPP